MKPAPFRYHRAQSVADALAPLASDPDAKVLAGGQSLIPLLNLRLVRPTQLVDINEIADLQRIYERDGGVAIGAAVRQHDAEESELVQRLCPLIPQGLKLVGNVVIRNRGTVCGSIAHADPASELSAILLALGGHVVVRSKDRERAIPAEDLFRGLFETSLQSDEIITEVWFPAARGRFGIEEECRRHGDFAMAGVAAAHGRLVVFGVGSSPTIVDPDDPTKGLRPLADLEASPEFKLHLVRVLAKKVMG